MLPHPAHAVFLLQAPDPLVLWSENAWTAAKHCGLIQQLLISAMKRSQIPRLFTAKPHSRNFLKSETKQNGLAQWLDVFVRSVGLLISKGTISEEDYGAHGFTGLFNFADIFQAFI